MGGMGDTCKTLAKVYGVLGAIGTVVVSFAWGRTAEIVGFRVEYQRNWILTLAIFFGVGLSVAMVSTALYTLGEIYDKVYYGSSFSMGNLGISSEAQSGLAALGREAEKERIINNGGWECPDCKKIHYSYETTCSCGKSKN